MRLQRGFISGAVQVDEGFQWDWTARGTPRTALIVWTRLVLATMNTQYGLSQRLGYCGQFHTIRLLRRTSTAGDNKDGPDTVKADYPDGAAVRSTILQGPPYGARATTGKAFSTDCLGPLILTVELTSSSHLPLRSAPVVTHQLSCHVPPHRFKLAAARGNLRPGQRIKQCRWMPTFAYLIPGWRGTAGDHLRLHGPALAHHPGQKPKADV